jgi:lipopolysaccharide biosynthesis glycosyltransferase
MDKNISKGVLYITAGEKYIQEACHSVASLKSNSPQLKATILTNTLIQNMDFDEQVLLKNPDYSFLDKVRNIYLSNYDRTLYLDSDTFICDDILEMFDLLDNFDIALSHAPGRFASGNNYHTYKMPESFPEMNGGVIMFKKSAKIDRFFENWLNFYSKDIELHRKNGNMKHNVHDQPSLRWALYASSLRIATLTPEYNCRFIFPSYISHKVKILHGRDSDLIALAKQINANLGKRVFIPNTGIVAK